LRSSSLNVEPGWRRRNMKGIARIMAAAAAAAIVFGVGAATAQAASMVEVGPAGADWPSGGSIVAGAYKK
jgi:hypothetical protein